MNKEQKETKKNAFWTEFKRDVEWPRVNLEDTERFYSGYIHGLYTANVLSTQEATEMQKRVLIAVNYQNKLRKEGK